MTVRVSLKCIAHCKIAQAETPKRFESREGSMNPRDLCACALGRGRIRLEVVLNLMALPEQNFSGALETWKSEVDLTYTYYVLTSLPDINLSELQKTLDAQGIEVVESQKESVVGRKALADKTKGTVIRLLSTTCAPTLR